MPIRTERRNWSFTDLLDVRSTVRDHCCGEISTSSFPILEPGPQHSKKQNVFPLCMSFIMGVIGMYILFSILLKAYMPYIIEASVERWQLGAIDLDIGASPTWIKDAPFDFRNIPPGKSNYTNISFSLSIANNPWWLTVDIFMADIRLRKLGILIPYPYNIPQYNNGTLKFRQLVPWVGLNEAAYVCLVYARNNSRTIVLDVALGARFSIFGYHSRDYRLTASVTDRSQRREGIAPNLSKKFGRGCLQHMAPRTSYALGKITAVEEFKFDPVLPLNRVATNHLRQARG